MDDQLIERLCARAADPARRTDVRPSAFTGTVRTLDLGGLLAGLAGARADLDRAVAAARRGRVDPEITARAQEIQRAMTTPLASALPPPADPAALDATERTLGMSLPASLRRVYAEIADGGFGPGQGLVSLARMVARYSELRAGAELPRGRAWPEGLLPVVDVDPGWDCVEAASGRVINWDPEGLSERSTEPRFRRSFAEVAPSVEAWLAAWVDAPALVERMADQVAAAQLKAAREARARIAAMSPEDRARMGLPAAGWERLVWGGLGLDEDDTT